MTRAVARLVMVSHITSRLLKYFPASQTTRTRLFNQCTRVSWQPSSNPVTYAVVSLSSHTAVELETRAKPPDSYSSIIKSINRATTKDHTVYEKWIKKNIEDKDHQKNHTHCTRGTRRSIGAFTPPATAAPENVCRQSQTQLATTHTKSNLSVR